MPKVSELPASVALDLDDVIPVVEDGVTRKATLQQVSDLIGGGGGSVPTGTGFRHVTAGTEDAASAKVDLTNSADVTVPTTGVVHSNGSVLSSSSVALGSEVSGTLPVANGGTGATTLTSGGVLIGAGTSAISAASNVLAGSGYVSIGATPSTTGAIRLSNNTFVYSRNAADSANLSVVGVDASNNVTVAGTAMSANESTGTVAVPGNVSVGTTPNSTDGLLRLGEVTTGNLITGRTNWTASFADAYILKVTSGYLLQLGRADVWDLDIYAVNLSLFGATLGTIYGGGGGSYVARWNGDGFQFGQTGSMDLGSGSGVIGIDNAATNPSTNPTNGGVLYADAGALKWRGSGGTVTTIATAEPHCPKCGRDFVLEYRNDDMGDEMAVCLPCLEDSLEAAGISGFSFKRKRTSTKEQWEAHSADRAARSAEKAASGPVPKTGGKDNKVVA